MTSLDTTTDCDMSLSEELAILLAEDSEPPAKKQVHCQGVSFVLLFVLLHRHIIYSCSTPIFTLNSLRYILREYCHSAEQTVSSKCRVEEPLSVLVIKIVADLSQTAFDFASTITLNLPQGPSLPQPFGVYLFARPYPQILRPLASYPQILKLPVPPVPTHTTHNFRFVK